MNLTNNFIIVEIKFKSSDKIIIIKSLKLRFTKEIHEGKIDKLIPEACRINDPVCFINELQTCITSKTGN
jgi:hypothetical protein